MRLLNVETFVLEDFTASGNLPPYAILSHTSGEDEASCQAIANPELAQTKTGLRKFAFYANMATTGAIDCYFLERQQVVTTSCEINN